MGFHELRDVMDYFNSVFTAYVHVLDGVYYWFQTETIIKLVFLRVLNMSVDIMFRTRCFLPVSLTAHQTGSILPPV